MSEVVSIVLDGKKIDLPVIIGTENEKAIDIAKLRSNSGFITMDTGYANTGSCLSSITYLNGEKGILRYRGIPIEVLAEKSNFIEVAYLLINGKLPNKDQFNSLTKKLTQYSDLEEGIIKLIQNLPATTHPMAALSAALVALSAYYPEYLKQDLSEDEIESVIPLMMAKIKQIVAAIFRLRQGKKYIPQNAKFDYCTDSYAQMFAPADGKIDQSIGRALDILFVLHADHEQNCSASTVRMVGSSKANPFAAISAGVTALWGPLHGGANQAVMEMLDAIHKAGGDYKHFLNRAKDKNDSFKLMGFGHRVYKNFDPRAKIIKTTCDDILKTLGVHDPVLDIAKGLETEALKDPYFVERKLYPNVDFYSGIIYRALGIPTDMFTVMFALGRLPGWMSQWKELLLSGARIARPRQIYTGPVSVNFVDIEKR